MRHRKVKKMIKTISLASFMLLGNTLPAFAMTGGTTENTSQSVEIGDTSSLSFNQTQLSSAEQLQNLYLQKVKFDPKVLDSSNVLDLIVQFDVDPAPIQMLNQ
jgi:hypothetical protein